MNQSSRTISLIGIEKFNILKNSKVLVFGLGGVGAAVVEALSRAQIGSIDIVDKDTVDITNINRQIIALHSSVGKSKAGICKERILDINPECKVNAYEMFYLPDMDISEKELIDFKKYDYVVDAVDTVSAKIEIITLCDKLNVPVISCMGTGNKLYPEMFEIEDIYKTSMDPLAKVMRKELKKRGVKKLNVLYSKEKPIKTEGRTPASISFTPPVAGYIIAGKVIRDLIGCET